MHRELVDLLVRTRQLRNFTVESWVSKKIDLLNEYMVDNRLSACVVSVSGGVDSAAVLALAVLASKRPNSPIKQIMALAQPIHSTPSIQNRAYELGESLGVKVTTIDQSCNFDALYMKVEQSTGIVGNKFSRGQLRSYMRTPINYFVAQLLSQETPCIVLGTGNMDEDGYLLYFCKAGDGVVDVQLIADLHKSEVFKVAKFLEIPESILIAPPSADLWEGQTDEEELGLSYDFVELYTEIKNNHHEDWLESISHEALQEYLHLSRKADTIHNRNKHKEKFPVNLNLL